MLRYAHGQFVHIAEDILVQFVDYLSISAFEQPTTKHSAISLETIIFIIITIIIIVDILSAIHDVQRQFRFGHGKLDETKIGATS